MAGALKIKGLKTKKTEGVTKPGRRTESESSVANSNERTTGLAVNKKARPPEGQDQGSEGLISSSVEPEQAVEEERPSKWIHFGPTYGNDTEVNQIAKDSAWQHILEKSGGDVTSYLHSIVVIEREAIDSYDSSAAEQLTPQEFLWLMVKDGCFFLQLALHILGAGDSLGYPQQNFYFGVKSDSSSWIPAMFYVGNQIPYVVINALMNQTFFKEVITRGTEEGTWKRAPTQKDPVKLALYQTVVEPQLTLTKKQAHHHRAGEPPCDILSTLHNVLMGSRDDDDDYPSYYGMTEFSDLEEAGGSKEEDKFKFPSAGKLSKLGIKLRNTNEGITGIRFKNYSFSAYLYLPTFILFDAYAELLTSLVAYEELSLAESKREVTAYLRLIRDLIPTRKDFKILEKEGIIQVRDLKLKPARMLHKIVSHHDPSFTPGIRELGQKIKDYETVPWRQISFTCSIACGIITFVIAALTIVQTVFTVISYYNSRN